MRKPPTVDYLLEEEFAASDRSGAREALPGSDAFPPGSPHERILLAIIRLASGDLVKLWQMADAAKSDWRDVLYWADTPKRTRRSEELGGAEKQARAPR